MFKATNVTKRFGDLVAVNDISLELPISKTTVLLGPSGCGKSTFLRLLLGALEPDAGAIFFDGQPLNNEYLIATRRQIGFVPQDSALFPHLTAAENIGLPAECSGRSKSDVAARVLELCDLVQLPPDTMDRYPNELSGGQRGRVAIARGLVLDPPAVVLDEPMAALDPLVRFELQQDLLKIFEQLKKTVVMVTHDLQEASRLADLVVMLQSGTIIQQGMFDEFVNEPASDYVETFFNAQSLTSVGGAPT